MCPCSNRESRRNTGSHTAATAQPPHCTATSRRANCFSDGYTCIFWPSLSVVHNFHLGSELQLRRSIQNLIYLWLGRWWNNVTVPSLYWLCTISGYCTMTALKLHDFCTIFAQPLYKFVLITLHRGRIKSHDTRILCKHKRHNRYLPTMNKSTKYRNWTYHWWENQHSKLLYLCSLNFLR